MSQDFRSDHSLEAFDRSLGLEPKKYPAQHQNSQSQLSGTELAEIEQDLFSRLVKTEVLQLSPSIKTFIDR